MNRNQKLEYTKLAEILCEHTNKSLIEITALLDKLHRYETTLHRLSELECNGWPRQKIEYREGKMYSYPIEDEDLRRKSEKKEANTVGKVKKIIEELNIKVEFNGDPRGGAIRLRLPKGEYNSMDGETYGIYW